MRSLTQRSGKQKLIVFVCAAHYMLHFSLQWFITAILFLSALGPNAAHGHVIHEVSSHTQRRTTIGRTPLGQWSARRTDLYPTTHNTHKRQTSMPLAGFEPAIPASERPQTHAVDHAANGIGPPLPFNPLNAELNPICHLLALLGGATIVVVRRLRVKRTKFR